MASRAALLGVGAVVGLVLARSADGARPRIRTPRDRGGCLSNERRKSHHGDQVVQPKQAEPCDGGKDERTPVDATIAQRSQGQPAYHSRHNAEHLHTGKVLSHDTRIAREDLDPAVPNRTENAPVKYEMLDAPAKRYPVAFAADAGCLYGEKFLRASAQDRIKILRPDLRNLELSLETGGEYLPLRRTIRWVRIKCGKSISGPYNTPQIRQKFLR